MSQPQPTPEPPTSPSEILAPGSTFARYQIVRCIGIGGMGSVFEATHTLLRKRVALKTMHAALGRSEAGLARFLREAETVARVRHPNVVDITDVGIENGVPFLVMEFLEGHDLARLLEHRGMLSPEEAVDIVVAVAAGLAAVHRLGIVHRDVKPENVFLARDAHGAMVPKLVDFGVSKALESTPSGGPSAMHTVTGTPHYMSPEQARGSAMLDGRTDQYALGIMLYQCLTGARPYDSQSLLELIHLIDSGDFRPMSDLRAELAPELVAIVHRAMARDAHARFPSTEALGKALLPFASERTRLFYERDFAEEHASFQMTPLASAAGGADAYSAPTTPVVDALAQQLSRTKLEQRSGVRMRTTQPNAGAQAEPVAPRRAGRWFLLGAAIALVVVVAALALVLRDSSTRAEREPSATSTRFELRLDALPVDASIELDGTLIGRGHVERTLERDGREHVLRVTAPGYASRELSFRDVAPLEQRIELIRVAEPPKEPVVPPQATEPAPSTRAEGTKHKSVKSRHVAKPAPTSETKPSPAPLDIQLSR